MQKIEIKSLSLNTLEEQLLQMGEKPFRAKQIFKWLHFPVESFSEMSDISKKLCEKLDEKYIITVPKIVEKQTSKIDGTIKYLWELFDGELIESVLMKYNHGYSICVSSQVGCRMACTFCASGKFGLKRNLSCGEILDQIIFINKDENIRISNVVMMGSGEPLDNYDNTISFIKNANNPVGINIGQRHFTVSTSGICDKIDALAKEDLSITLAISLHSADNDSRDKIMPVNKAYNIETLIKTCNNYFSKTGRRISYEYAMIDGITDTIEQAEKLSKILSKVSSHVNLIPLNEISASNLKKSSKNNIHKFQDVLEKCGISATIRRTLGPDIDAACGQLRGNNIKVGD